MAASRDGREGSLRIEQDANILLAQLDARQELSRDVPAGRYGWLQVLRGSVSLDGQAMKAGDGAAITGPQATGIRADGPAEVMFFDLP